MATEASASSTAAKPLLVRVKRKRLLPPVESIWLEVSERPTKRLEAQLRSFSLNDTSKDSNGEEKPTRLLFRHLDTFTSFEATEATRVDSLLREVKSETGKERHRDGLKNKDLFKNKLPTARQNYQALTQKARFEQVWKSRKGVKKPDAISEQFELYDLLRVDVDLDAIERNHKQEEEKRKADLEEAQMLQKFLPLFQEYMPTVAAEVQSSTISSSEREEVSTEEYVYDVYALEEFPQEDGAGVYDFPLVHVVDNDCFRWGSSSESDYDSEDSNDENNPMNDYPDEEDDSEEPVSEEEDSESVSEEEDECSEESENFIDDVFEKADVINQFDNDWSDISYESSEERE